MKDLIITLILLSIIGLIGLRLFEKYSQGPSQKTIKAATSIKKYSQAQTWKIKENRNVCFFMTSSCNQSVTIKFNTINASWGLIYNYFMDYMKGNGWESKSLIITRIPNSVTFTNLENCQADLTKDSLRFFGLDEGDNGKYSLAITCNQ